MPQMTDNPILGERFDAALAMASALHRRQERKGTRIPYVSHLLAVTAIVLEHGGREDEAIAALLHDAVEDQGGSATLQAIRERFGDGVAGLVEELSDTDGDSKAGAADWRARKERYLRHLETASDSARLVSAADKLDNLRALVADLQREGEGVWGRFNAGREDIAWYYREIVGCVRRGGPQSLAEPLGEALRDLECFEVRGGLAKAIAIAARVHLLQKDKAGAPYILHPLRVMNAVEVEAAKTAAVLHDVVEDGEGWTLERLGREGFSEEVVGAVENLTKRSGEDYDAFVSRAAGSNIAKAVKKADLADNMDLRRLGELSPRDLDRLAKYHRNFRCLATD